MIRDSREKLSTLCKDKDIAYEKVESAINEIDKEDPSLYLKEDPLLSYVCGNESCTLDIIKLLVEKKANMNSQSGVYLPPIIEALKNQKITFEIIKILIEKKVSLNFNNSR